MKKNTLFRFAWMIVLVCMCFMGCNDNIPRGAIELNYSTGVNEDGLYDNSLFYRNDLLFEDAPDPGAFYEDGWFYMYPTAAPIKCFRTRNFANYEYMGYAFSPSNDSLAYGNFWAPEVIKNPKDGKYYMYYNASMKDNPVDVPNATQFERMRIGVAVADKPQGPFRECVDKDNNSLFFDFLQSSVAQEWLQDKQVPLFAAIDASPYFDENGDLYLYFVKHMDRNEGKNSIWGIKMASMTEPLYDTLKQLTQPGFDQIDGAQLSIESGCGINEGPYMLRHTTAKPDGTSVTKYYLTYSIFGYTDKKYSVATAISDKPLGDFIKYDKEYGQPFHKTEPDFDHMAGTGHHSFAQAGEELFIIYHAHKDPTNGNGGRAIAADRITYEYNESLGIDLLHSNGPTKSLQPIPFSESGYHNLASDAVITATGSSDKAGLLQDGSVVLHHNDLDKEFRFSANDGGRITIEFPQEKSVRAIMIYNSYDISFAFSKIDSIVFHSDAEKKDYFLKDLLFPSDYYWEDLYNIRPGGAAVAEFQEIKVKKITLTIRQKLDTEEDIDYTGIGLSEIIVLGK